MARPADDSLVAVEFELPLPNYLNVTDFQRQIRFVIDMVTILTPPGSDGVVIGRQRDQLDPVFTEFDDQIQFNDRAYDLITADKRLQNVDLETVSRVLRSEATAAERQREAREDREPSFRQIIGRRRKTTQRRVEVTELRYGSNLTLTMQTGYSEIAIALVVLTYLFAMVSNARRNASDNNTRVNMNDLQNEIIDYLRTELPHMSGPEADPGLYQVTELLFRMEEIKQIKAPPAALFPELPAIPNIPGLQLPVGAQTPAGQPPGEAPQL